ncbi:MAG: hypothetical protein NT163_02070 [Chlorobiales bacterium]|nr:hypothetical protein [Chlorobiales bacterium]
MWKKYRDEQFRELHHILNLIEKLRIKEAIDSLREEIVPIDDIDIPDLSEKALLKRSNSFLGGAINNLNDYLQLPPINLLVDGAASFPACKKIANARKCVETVMRQGGWTPPSDSELMLETIQHLINSRQGVVQVKCVPVEPIKRNEPKKPGGRRGLIYQWICEMSEDERIPFTSLHSGDQQFYDMLYTDKASWRSRYKKSYPDDTKEQFRSAVEKGKQLFKKPQKN